MPAKAQPKVQPKSMHAVPMQHQGLQQLKDLAQLLLVYAVLSQLVLTVAMDRRL